MDKMYISPFVVMGLEGIGGLIMMTVGLSILCILPISDTLSFHNYAIFIGHAFGHCSAMLPYFGLLSFGLFGFNTFKVLTNHYYFPTYKGLSDVIGNFIRWILFSSIGLVKNDNESDYYIIKVISYVILTIGVIIYLELIQLNCCGLNVNTRNEISIRIKEEKDISILVPIIEQNTLVKKASMKDY